MICRAKETRRYALLGGEDNTGSNKRHRGGDVGKFPRGREGPKKRGDGTNAGKPQKEEENRHLQALR